jgi:hypothetical protein
MTQRSNVRPPIIPLTELDAREMLAKPLRSLCSKYGPTKVGSAVHCNEKTIRAARDETATLKFHTVANLLALDGSALDPVLAHYGRVSVDLSNSLPDEPDRTSQSKLLKAALALSVALEDDEKIDEGEVRANYETLVAARTAIDRQLRKLVRAA